MLLLLLKCDECAAKMGKVLMEDARSSELKSCDAKQARIIKRLLDLSDAASSFQTHYSRRDCSSVHRDGLGVLHRRI